MHLLSATPGFLILTFTFQLFSMVDHFIAVNHINLHYVEYPGEGTPLLLIHGLTANAHAFEGLIAAGLNKDHHLYSVDLRGRGLSDHPAFCYTMQEHAEDILGLLDHLGLEKVILCGHSFGGLLSFYLAANYPERVEKLIILDAAARMNPNAAEMLSFRLSKLDVVYPSWEAYLEEVKAAPYNTFWDEAMLPYYEADVKPAADGGITPRSNLVNIIEASMGVANTPWPELIDRVNVPVLLINAPDIYNIGEPLLPDNLAHDTVDMLPHGHYIRVDGNHQTMLYGDGAKQIVKAIGKFLNT